MTPLNTVENTIEQTNYDVEAVLEKQPISTVDNSEKHLLMMAGGFVLFFVIGLCLISNHKNNTPAESEIKLEKLNKVLVYDTILLEDNNLSHLQNNIYQDLKNEKQNINYVIANPDLLVMDFNTKELSGYNLKIGNDASIDVTTNKDKKFISYNNFSESGKNMIMKQIDKNNYPKINMKALETKNKDDTYNINLVIENNT